jgi:predicted dehydrogenase
VVAVCNEDRANGLEWAAAYGTEWAEEIGCRYESDVDAILRSSDIDALLITTATARHADLIVRAAVAGKHVFIEKTLAATNEDAYAIRDAVAKSGIHFTKSDPVKEPYMAFAKRLADEGRLGALTGARFRSVHPLALYSTHLTQFYGLEKGVSGAMLDLGSHAARILSWFLGKAVCASGLFVSHSEIGIKSGVDENAVAIYKFANGAIGTAEVGWCSPWYQNEFNLYGTRACVNVLDDRLHYRLDGGDWIFVPKADMPAGDMDSLNYWTESILADTPNVEYCIDEAVHLTQMITAAYRARGKEFPL